MKKILFFVLLLSLLFTACPNPNSSTPEKENQDKPVVEEPGGETPEEPNLMELPVGKYYASALGGQVILGVEITESNFKAYWDNTLYFSADFTEKNKYELTENYFSFVINPFEVPIKMTLKKSETETAFSCHVNEVNDPVVNFDTELNKVESWFVYDDFCEIETTYTHQAVTYTLSQKSDTTVPDDFKITVNLIEGKNVIKTIEVTELDKSISFDNLTSIFSYKVNFLYTDSESDNFIKIFSKSFSAKNDEKHEVNSAWGESTECDVRIDYFLNSDVILSENLETKMFYTLKNMETNQIVSENVEVLINEDESWFKIDDLTPETDYELTLVTENGSKPATSYFKTGKTSNSIQNYLNAWCEYFLDDDDPTVIDGKNCIEAELSFRNFGNKSISIMKGEVISRTYDLEMILSETFTNDDQTKPFIKASPGDVVEFDLILGKGDTFVLADGKTLDDVEWLTIEFDSDDVTLK